MIVLLLGSESDQEFASKITAELDKWDVPYEIKIASAHKVPKKVAELVENYNKEEGICYITIAGRSNGLSGVTAASSVHPVIACPPFNDKDDMMVNIHSTLQMPSDVPVLTVLDPKNAAQAAIRILGLGDSKLKEKIQTRIRDIQSKY